MSFDIHCIAFQSGRSGVGDAEAARQVLSRATYQLHEGARDSYEVQFSDGSHVALYADGLTGGDKPFNGAMFELHGGSWTLNVMQFIRDFAAAGRLIIFPQDPVQPMLPFEQLREELPPSLTEDQEPIVVSNGHELGVALSGGPAKWDAEHGIAQRDKKSHEV